MNEKALIKAVTDPQNVQAIIGGVKLSAPGLAKAQQQAKRDKKARGKARAQEKEAKKEAVLEKSKGKKGANIVKKSG